jgi:hypothetical protein
MRTIVLEIRIRLPAVPARALEHVEGHAQHPVACRGPGDGDGDPVPEVREGPHVDHFEKRLVPVQRPALPPSAPATSAALEAARDPCHPRNRIARGTQDDDRTFSSHPFPPPSQKRRAAPTVARDELSVNDLIWPVFVTRGEDAEHPIPSMPGVERLTVDRVVRAAEEAAASASRRSASFPTPTPR